MTVVIDTPERIGRAFPIIDVLAREHGLVTSELVPAARNTIGCPGPPRAVGP